MPPTALEFYRRIDREAQYLGSGLEFLPRLTDFIRRWDLRNKRCLEIGSNQGDFQDVVKEYVGVDVAEHLRSYYHKPYVVVTGADLPFEDDSFDGVFTHFTLEHIPEIDVSLSEITRVLRPGGVCLLAPDWFVPWWAGAGLAVRPYGDLAFRHKIRKSLLPLTDIRLVRVPFILSRRLVGIVQWSILGRRSLIYGKLSPDYETYWHADSDACNRLDPFFVVLWFRSRGFAYCSSRSAVGLFFMKGSDLVFRKPESA